LEEEDWDILEKAQEEKKQQAEKIQQNIELAKNKPVDEGANVPIDEQGDVVKTELDKWKRKATNAIKAGKSASVDFESDKIPAELKASILKKLSEVKTEEDIRLIFSNGRH
jgi:hypothetical protein